MNKLASDKECVKNRIDNTTRNVPLWPSNSFQKSALNCSFLKKLAGNVGVFQSNESICHLQLIIFKNPVRRKIVLELPPSSLCLRHYYGRGFSLHFNTNPPDKKVLLFTPL
jgi:hypothetical protein